MGHVGDGGPQHLVDAFNLRVYFACIRSRLDSGFIEQEQIRFSHHRTA
jgi:hypothetical protein